MGVECSPPTQRVDCKRKKGGCNTTCRSRIRSVHWGGLSETQMERKECVDTRDEKASLTPFAPEPENPSAAEHTIKGLRRKSSKKNLRAHSELLFRTHNGGNSEGLESDSRFLYVSYLHQTRVESRRTSVVTFVSRWQHFLLEKNISKMERSVPF
ncbi:hypothetical protein CDAR_241331 [Caerostris darwini]|uniref:Uncharacterized protein n=1 Tax=Caerostris darwini TaxID=1538125 RepID=A0AAV4TIM4_9ARAC|nr:hypothetical protein CDAR_241331 [Caerostris darwini]